MKMSGQEKIAAPREKVWAALNDASVLKKSITGCKTLIKSSDTEFSATVQAKVGPVKATFNGDVKLSKLNPPKSYVLSGQGKGGVAGFAKGKATVKLAEDGNDTILTYDVDAQVGGKLAQIGSRLISSTANKMANDFFKKFAKLASNYEMTDGSKPKTTTNKPAKKAVKKATKKVTAKKSAKKITAKKAVAKATPAPVASSVPAAPADPTLNLKEIQQPKPNPLLAFFLAALGGAVLLFYYLLFT